MPAFGLNHQGANILVITLTAATWTLLVLSIRVFLRLKINGPFGLDDFTCILATVLALTHSAITLTQLQFGLGRHDADVDQTAIHWASFLLWLGNFFYYTAAGLSMLSVCFLLARVVRLQRLVWGCYGIAVATVAWAFAACVANAFECALPRPWDIRNWDSHCGHLWAMNACLIAFRTALETANIVAAVVMLWSLQMPLPPKIQIIAAFSVRLIVLPPLLVRLHFVHIALFSPDWPRARVPGVILTQVVLHLSVMLATIPCVKPFLRLFENGGLQMPFSFVKKVSARSGIRAQQDGRHDSAYGLTSPKGAWTRVERWERLMRRPNAHTVTTIRHDPRSLKEEARRRRSFESSTASKRGIVRTDSFAVTCEAARPIVDQVLPARKASTVSFQLDSLPI